MAEEQFTSRRARREAERMAAEQAFEARETPEQPNEPSSNEPAELNDPLPASEASAEAPEPEPGSDVPGSAETAPGPDAEPPPHITDEQDASVTDRDASAAEQPPESQPPIGAADGLDPQRAPLPHFDSRSARKNYLREHGLSSQGDVSTGAVPVVAGPEETSAEAAEEASGEEDESFDAAGFGGSADEVAARDFESPITADSAPRPTALDDAPHDALSTPIEELDAAQTPADQTREAAEPSREVDGQPSTSEMPDAESVEFGEQETESDQPAQSGTAPTDPVPSAADDEDADEHPLERESTSRSRRMPIVQPPSSSGVRVVTAASAQIPEPESSASTTIAGADEATAGGGESSADQDEPMTSTNDSAGLGTFTHAADSADELDSAEDSASAEDSHSAGGHDSAAEAETSSDEAARALAANPETRPMETVPEAWALPNPDYEDEETENPPGTRIRASEVTGHDGRILVGEEPSKVPYVVLGVAALFAVALIVIALVMLL